MKAKEKVFLKLSDDLLFKEAFAHPDNRNILIYFLSCFTDFTKEYLESVEIRVEYESVLAKTKSNDRSVRGDVIIKFDGHIINLEAYSSFDRNSFDKSMYYIMRIFSTRTNRGKKSYKKLEKVIQINIVDDVTPKDLIEKMVENTMSVKDAKNNEIYSNIFQIKYYRLDTLKKMIYDKDNLKQRWLKFICAKTAEERKKIAKGDALLMKFDNWCEEYVNDEQTKKIFADWADYVAENKGLRKGLAQGETLGIKKGIAQGSLEKAYEIAKNLLKLNMSKKDIAKATGLSMKEIKSLA